MATLAGVFSTGATDTLKDAAVGILERERYDPRDVSEGVQRLIHAREKATFPKPAEIMRRISEARADRTRADSASARELGDGTRRHTRSDLPHLRAIREIAKYRKGRAADVPPGPESPAPPRKDH